MADLDAELALFQAEIAAVEEQVSKDQPVEPQGGKLAPPTAPPPKKARIDDEIARFEAELAATEAEAKQQQQQYGAPPAGDKLPPPLVGPPKLSPSMRPPPARPPPPGGPAGSNGMLPPLPARPPFAGPDGLPLPPARPPVGPPPAGSSPGPYGGGPWPFPPPGGAPGYTPPGAAPPREPYPYAEGAVPPPAAAAAAHGFAAAGPSYAAAPSTAALEDIKTGIQNQGDAATVAATAAAAHSNGGWCLGAGAAKGEDGKSKKKPKAMPRAAGGEKWWDASLTEWPENDFRIFVGNLGNEVNDDTLTKAFSKYSSLAKAKIIRDKRTRKSKGYGFVSLMDPVEGAQAIREMNEQYIGNRPCALRKSALDSRIDETRIRGKGGKRKNHYVH